MSSQASADTVGLRALILQHEGPTPPGHVTEWLEGHGAGVEVLARVGDRPVLCREGAVLVSSFHPELSDDLRLHQRFLEGI